MYLSKIYFIYNIICFCALSLHGFERYCIVLYNREIQDTTVQDHDLHILVHRDCITYTVSGHITSSMFIRCSFVIKCAAMLPGHEWHRLSQAMIVDMGP